MKTILRLLLAFLTAVTLAGCGGEVHISRPPSPTSGCTNPKLSPGETQGTIDVNGLARTYFLVVPSSVATAPTSPRSLVFGYHGSGGTGEGIHGYLGLEGPANGAAIFVYPDGLDGVWPDTDGRDIAFFDALLAKISAEGCVDSGRVYAAGFSYGGVMSNRVGCARAGVVRGIAPLAGGGPWGSCNGKDVAAWLTFGNSDTYFTTESRDYWIKNNHCSTESGKSSTLPCVVYYNCDVGYPVVWCQFAGGHEVPSWVGPSVWNFFSGL